MADRQRTVIRQIVGFLCLGFSAFLIASFLSLTVIASVPLLLITSPLWVPLAAIASVLVFGAASAAAASTWLFRYFSGLHPAGSDRVDFARNRIADTASHVKDYARGYGGYLHSRFWDAAPGA